MNKIALETKGSLTLVASTILIICSAGLIVSAAKMNAGTRAEWPKAVPYDAAIHAFDAALTKAVRDPAFRARLTESPDSARQAVEEVGNINILNDRVIVFYEPQAAPSLPPLVWPRQRPQLWPSQRLHSTGVRDRMKTSTSSFCHQKLLTRAKSTTMKIT